jgi:putative protease
LPDNNKTGCQIDKNIGKTDIGRPEILAPAGSPEAFRAAVLCGADAVYVGGKMFSARANAANFDFSELEEAVKFAHLRGVNIYIAANTIIFNGELKKFAEYTRRCAEIGVDAFIVCDIGGAKIIRETIKGAVLHASTQMTVFDRGGAELLKANGFKRVVAARELDRDGIADIAKSGLETEVFVHGALCMSVSGQCLMSAMIGGRSANRGDCAQSCRLPFCIGKSYREGENALSLKDLSLINRVNELVECGVTSLKIEGRMKRPEYVAAAVMSLKAAIKGETPDLELLKSVFSRSGFTDGYFTGKKLSMFGTRTKDDVTAAEAILPEIRKSYLSEVPSIPVNIEFTAKPNELLQLYVSDENERVCVGGTYGPPEKSVKTPTTAENVTVQLSKLGGTPFFAKEIKTDISEGLFIPKSLINLLRRRAVEMFSEWIIKEKTPQYSYTDYKEPSVNTEKGYPQKFIAEIFHKSQLEAIPDLINLGGKVVVPIELLTEISEIPELYYANIIISLPKYGNFLSILSNIAPNKFAGLLCQNLAHISAADKFGFKKYGGIHLNAANIETVNVLKNCGFEAVTASIECKFREISTMPELVGIYAYGRVPVMMLAVCPINGGGACPKTCEKTLTDRTSRHFTVNCKREYGYVELLNPDILCLSDCTDYIAADYLYLSFFDESPTEINEITQSFLNKTGKKRENITRGLYKGNRAH